MGPDAVAALAAIALAGLLLTDRLVVQHLYVFSAVGAVLASIRNPSYQAAVSSVLPRDSLTRASGLVGLSQGVLSLIVPVMADVLMASFGLRGIVMIQIPVVIGGGLAVFGAFSRSRNTVERRDGVARPGFLNGFVSGLFPAFAFLRKEPLMKWLLVYIVVHDGMLALASSMLTPLILSTHHSTTVGLVTSIVMPSGAITSTVNSGFGTGVPSG